MRVARSYDCEKIDAIEKIRTPEIFEEAVAAFSIVAKKLSDNKRIIKSAGGIAGILDRNREKLLYSPNLQKWVNRALKQELTKILGTDLNIENDASMVGLGEAVYGAGKGYEIVSYITVSTGVGGSRIVNGKIDENVNGFEPGHQIIDADGSLCSDCVGTGDLESYISGSAIKKRFNKNPKEIKDPNLWIQLSNWLAYGLLNTSVHWSPDIIVLGGSMLVGAPAISVEQTENKLRDIMAHLPIKPIIKKAELSDIGGIMGSLAYLKNTLN